MTDPSLHTSDPSLTVSDRTGDECFECHRTDGHKLDCGQRWRETTDERCTCDARGLMQHVVWAACPTHGDVDAILASGRYVDRRGRVWLLFTDGEWRYFSKSGARDRRITPAHMRMKIIRELHRDECPGLRNCLVHPVVNVNRLGDGNWAIWGPGDWYRGRRPALAEAFAAAYNLATAVGATAESTTKQGSELDPAKGQPNG